MKDFKKYKAVTPGLRNRLDATSQTQAIEPEKRLKKILAKHSGRNVTGRVTVRHQGGRQKRFFRVIDYKRDKRDIKARVASIEYDPNRSANIALLYYKDGEKRYIIAPRGLKIDKEVEAGEKADLKIGNALPLKKIPLGMAIHNLEISPGRGGQLVRGAGGSATIRSKEKGMAIVKLPSGELRRVSLKAYATLGQIGNIHLKDVSLGKAGRKRLKGIRPSVRGVAMHPGAHPHGGGEGRSGIGMPSPKSPWGKRTLGKKTRKRKKYSNKYIVRDRRK
ncbi:50S ribosomal protein L2 [Candidatus Beckwithbacteria bacterium CG10_big_fil_rev_8_21_14_0_10_34_10]|uniref:Large ribosomal subunit protein uL2 n=1 Tax=Candidatus Beckwithbacteria bacterium CG10_big_fil_rev_8_21_14_0_10_34_10 TaxID=1974495 RepID=A0A2H0W9W6_9BACT|nr:MAG: 50S ribosomal protein L2 [Candidatus Beckwithbacteria bacterium CG10_big_fil_rev_8_21_14_0_10_34_10]